ncbi:MAG: hypothetical protein B6I24_01975 [Bacteroidetes bacterium 4572_128]|nr:MAG: hypothetical protein B6I24_01975 [Bacteroidetes bacterium 4572_128]
MQDYIISNEYCAIYLNNKLSHIVEKKGMYEDNIDNFNIHHKNFGGKNILHSTLDNKIIKFAKDVFNKIPKWIKEDPFIIYERIDILSNKLNMNLYLLEIEAFVPDIFLRESGNINKYCKLIKKLFKKI